MTAVAVTGLKAEAEIARKAGLQAVCAGGVPRRTAAAVERAIADGATFLVSFGIAGGLDPRLRPGTIVTATAVVDATGKHLATLAPLRIDGAVGGMVCGADTVAGSAAEKAALFDASGARCVDLESHVVVTLARRAGLPAAVLRAIADPAERSLPAAARIALKPDGMPALGPVMRSVLFQPGQIGPLVRLALDTRAALRALAAAAARLRAGTSPALGITDS